MKTKLFLCIAVVSQLVFASCKPDVIEITSETNFSVGPDQLDPTSTKTFVATTEDRSASRTELSESVNANGCYSLYWTSGDKISVSDGKGIATFVTYDSETTEAEFIRSEGTIDFEATNYTAFYPATITHSNMVLPPTQNYVDGNINNFPMMAESNDKNLAFKNLCGIIRFCLKSETDDQLSITSICLSADEGMSGNFVVGSDHAAVVTDTDGIVLNCEQPVVLSSTTATDFNIAVPQGDYFPLNVKIYDNEGREVNLISEGTVPVKRSEITRINLTISETSFDSSLETIPVTDVDVDFTIR